MQSALARCSSGQNVFDEIDIPLLVVPMRSVAIRWKGEVAR